MKKIFKITVVLLVILSPNFASAKKKRQTIDLEGADIDGEIRTPTGEYLLQKSGVDFLPLYEKKKEMSDEIKKTIHFLR